MSLKSSMVIIFRIQNQNFSYLHFLTSLIIYSCIDFAAFIYPVQPVVCMCSIFYASQKYYDELCQFKGSYYKLTELIALIPTTSPTAYEIIELRLSTLIDVNIEQLIYDGKNFINKFLFRRFLDQF